MQPTQPQYEEGEHPDPSGIVTHTCRFTMNPNLEVRKLRPKKINYPNSTSIDFTYDNFYRIDDDVEKALRKIEVTKSGNIIYGYQFNYIYTNRIWDNETIHSNYVDLHAYTDYTGNQNFPPGYPVEAHTLMLKEFYKYTDNGTLPSYVFDYDTTSLIRRGAQRASDVMGYYNGALSEDILTEVQGMSNGLFGISGGFRIANLIYTKAKSLKSISTPFGGKYLFDYELNTANSSISSAYYLNQYLDFDKVPGLRVKTISILDGVGGQVQKTYKYLNENGSSSGVLTTDMNFLSVFSQRKRDYPSHPAYSSICDEYVPCSIPLGYLYYCRSSIPLNKIFLTRGLLVGYNRVEEYLGSDVNYAEKNVSEFYTTYDLSPLNSNPHDSPFPNSFDKGFVLGTLKSEKKYTNSNDLKEETFYNYKIVDKDLSSDLNFRCLKVQMIKDPPVDNTSFKFKEHFPVTGWMRLLSINYRRYFSNGIKFDDKMFEYISHDGFDFLSRTYISDSKYNDLCQQVHYPFEYNIQGAINTLNNLKIGSFPIVTELWKGQIQNMKLISSKATTLKLLPDNSVKQDEVFELATDAPITESQWGTFDNTKILQHPNSFISKGKFDLYDTWGNPTQLSNKGVFSSQLWGYNNRIKIANVQNAKFEDIMYTSFEDDCEQDKWQFIGLPQIPVSGITGEKGFSISSFNSIECNSLSFSKRYTISFWAGINNPPQVGTWLNGNQGPSYYNIPLTPSEIHNGWQLYKATFVNGAGVKLYSTNPTNIDELRCYPEGALMTTSTSHPIFGVTSMCDANNVIIYTEYDEFGRVKTIRDADKNILKLNEYVNQQQY
jgi:hypothetical protein